MARRQVFVHGQWHLWIYCCNWQVSSKGKRIGDSSSRTRIVRAADFLDGQKLIAFSFLPIKLQSIFEFDFKTSLRTIPYDRESEQWLFFQPAHKLLKLRADGRYQLGRSDRPDDANTWKLI